MGIANGLAWTSVGGEMLPVEVALSLIHILANQTSGKDGKGRELVCSFCGRSQNEVEQLVIGPGAVSYTHLGVNDSKKLTEKRREALFEEITNRALAYKIVFISPQEIDERNILWATMDGMAQAVAGLETVSYTHLDVYKRQEW